MQHPHFNTQKPHKVSLYANLYISKKQTSKSYKERTVYLKS